MYLYIVYSYFEFFSLWYLWFIEKCVIESFIFHKITISTQKLIIANMFCMNQAKQTLYLPIWKFVQNIIKSFLFLILVKEIVHFENKNHDLKQLFLPSCFFSIVSLKICMSCKFQIFRKILLLLFVRAQDERLSKSVLTYVTLVIGNWFLSWIQMWLHYRVQDSNRSWRNVVPMRSGLDYPIGLVSLFNGISTFVGYLIPKPFS